MTISFFWGGPESLDELSVLEPERDWQSFCDGGRIWVLQTFLRLRRDGCPVRLTDSIPEEGTLVYFNDHAPQLRRFEKQLHRVEIVSIVGDRSRLVPGDFFVFQNGFLADGGRRFFIPIWPQPGLLPREVSRKQRVERIGFKGTLSNLDPGFRSRRWLRFLADNDFDWDCDATSFDDGGTARQEEVSWRNFRHLDVVLAVRPPRPDLWLKKPAAKLINAWHAGVPAILGREHAYRELRRSELDYIEVESPQQARTAILRLRDSPDLYRRMVENGRSRSHEFSVARLTELWRILLEEIVPSAVRRGAVGRKGLIRRLWFGAHAQVHPIAVAYRQIRLLLSPTRTDGSLPIPRRIPEKARWDGL